MFDGCVHTKFNSFHYIKIQKKLQANKINNCLIMFDKEKNFKERLKFLNNCKKFSNLTPVAFLRNTKNLKSEIDNIIKLKYRFIKIHPRKLKINYQNIKFYKKVF